MRGRYSSAERFRPPRRDGCPEPHWLAYLSRLLSPAVLPKRGKDRAAVPPRNSEATGAKGSPTAPAVKAQTGRVLGPRALQTRQRLLVAAAELFRERSALDLSVAEIARRAGTSAATFYHYFADVEEAALHLARQAAEEMPAVLDLIDGPWPGEQGLVTAQRIVEAFMHHWEAHHAVLLIRNLAADHGDPRFQEARRRALSPFLERLAERVAEFQAGRGGFGSSPRLCDCGGTGLRP